MVFQLQEHPPQITLGPKDLKIGHLGQVCTLCTFSHQTLHTALDKCLDHFQSEKMSKYHIVTSNHPIYHLKEHD